MKITSIIFLSGIIAASFLIAGCKKEHELVFPTGELTDNRDGQVYKWVQIDKQTWFAENLNFSTGSSWCYNNDSTNCDQYGRLYSWDDALIACPNGWHLPSSEEWGILEQFLDDNISEYVGAEWGDTDKGKRLKSTYGWNSSGNGTNDVGFTALPGGERESDGHFYYIGDYGFWWTASDFGAWSRIRLMLFWDVGVGDRVGGKEDGYSIRCIKD